MSEVALAISQHSVTSTAFLGWGHMRKKQPIFNPRLLERVNPILPFPTGHWAVSQDLHGLWVSTEHSSHLGCAIYSLSDPWATPNPLGFRDLTCKDEEAITR